MTQGEAVRDLPLLGLRVVDLGQGVAAPYCARLLADAGAEVIKVEGPQGDEARRHGPFPDDVPDPNRSGLFLYLNANKQGVTLDIRSSTGGRLLESLLKDADILVHNNPPRETEELGQRLASLHREYPRLIVTSITPFGQSGPYRHYQGDDLIAVNMGGLAYATPGFPDQVADPEREPPLRPATYVADLAAGIAGAVATLLALLARERDGLGRQVDVSKQEVIASLMAWDLANSSYLGLAKRRGSRLGYGPMPNGYLPCKDGYVVVTAITEEHWQKLVEVMGSPDWAQSPLFCDSATRGDNWDALRLLLLEWTMAHTGQEIHEMAQARGIPCFPAYEVGQAIATEQVAARGFLRTVEVGPGRRAMFPGLPFRFGDTPWPMRMPAPRLGEHTALLLSERSESNPAGPDSTQRAGSRGGGQQDGAVSGCLPLKGIRVVDFGQAVAVPFAAQWLALMGAEVIVVESRQRPASRRWPPFADDVPGVNRSGHFNLFNSSKLSCTVNLRTEAGREIARSLVRFADVVAENFSTGTMEKLGLGYQDLVGLRPDIIMLSMSAAGRSGPMRHFVGYHSAVLMLSGLAAITGYPQGPPRIMGSVFPDPVSGMYGVFAVLGALYRRSRTGQGQYIDVAMTEAMMTLMPEAIISCTLNGRQPRRVGNRHPLKAPHGVYRCEGDDAWIAISVGSDDQWSALCDAVGHVEWRRDQRFCDALARRQHQEELDTLLQGWSRGRTPREAMRRLQEAGVPAGPSFTTADILEDPHLRQRGFVVEVDHPEVGQRPMGSVPWKISDLPPPKHGHAPLLGQDNHYVLCELLGLHPKRVERLVREKVVD